MYVWFEVMLISSFGLLVIGGGRDELDGAMKYVGLNLIATVAFLAGVGLLYGATGALNMADLHGRLDRAGERDADHRRRGVPDLRLRLEGRALPGVLLAAGLLPHPVLHHLGALRALLTKVGVYALIRVFTLVFPVEGTPIQTVLLAGAVLSMVAGSLGALAMTGTRRVLGFSIIASIGMMILGLAHGHAAGGRRARSSTSSRTWW